MKKVTQTSPESHDFHKKVKASVGPRGTAHSIATKNTGRAINGSNSHNRGRISSHKGSSGMGGTQSGGTQSSGC